MQFVSLCQLISAIFYTFLPMFRYHSPLYIFKTAWIRAKTNICVAVISISLFLPMSHKAYNRQPMSIHDLSSVSLSKSLHIPPHLIRFPYAIHAKTSTYAIRDVFLPLIFVSVFGK